MSGKCTINQNKWYPKDVYLLISKLHSILAVANLLAHVLGYELLTELGTKYFLLYLNTKYMIKMYLNTKYSLQMYLNTKYIDVFKYFCKYFLLFSKYRPYSFNLKMNEILDIKIVSLYSMSITDMHAIYYIACL